MCSILKPEECVGQAVQSAVGDAIQNFANAVSEMVGTAVTSLGTIWLYIGTPNLTTGGGGSPIAAGAVPPGSENISLALGYAKWIGLVMAAIAVIWLGILVAASLRRGEGALNVGRLGLVLAGVVMISGAGSLVGGFLPSGPTGAGGATLFIQSGLWWYMGAVAVLSVIVAGVRMVWENRADAGKDLIKSLFTLVVVAGAGVTLTQLLITASDRFAVWLLQGSLQCDVATDKACFGKNITALLALANPTVNPAGGGLGVMLVIVLGIIASLAAFVQIVLMVARSGMLVILAGILPLSAAATNTEMGKGWFRKCIGWLLAFLLYKPAAAVVYSAAFQMAGSKLFGKADQLVTVLTGLMLMLLAVIALPALMRFVTPLVGSLASGSAGGAMAVAAMAALPTGAAALGRLSAGSASDTASSSTSSGPSDSKTTAGPAGADASGPSGPSGPSGSGGPGSPSGSDGTGSSGGPGPSGGSGSSGGPGTSGADGAGAVDGSAGAKGVTAPGGGGGTQAAAQAAESGSGASGAAAGLGGGAAGAAGGASAAGAAGGPIGMVAAEGASKVSEAGQAAASAARGVASDATGEGDGPDGSN